MANPAPRVTNRVIHTVLRRVEAAVVNWKEPIVTRISRERSPYKVLISCVLSLRTQDATTEKASERLFALAATPAAMLALSAARIEKAIYPVGFYRTKARTLREISRQLLERYRGEVPDEIDELLTLPGVGRKTANLVVTYGYDKLGICVDTHVHRIANRWGYVAASSPDKTEMALRETLPRRHWIPLNDLLVTYGQNLCKPVSPLCSECTISTWCARIGVTKSR
ncbi:MAG: endonuclease III domain-containing protein [bacterium]